MRQRAISALAAALALVLTLVTPALAAGRPNWDGPLGAMAGPVVCETGRDYVLYYTIIGGVYRSADGVTWTELDRQWASAGWAYGTGVNGLAHKEFQFLWTGSEYMMRQSLLDDPREDTHQQYGDSPRNNWVTLLDEGFRIIGAKAFDGPVTDIRYAGGTYYATVDGVEHAFTRTDWEPGREGGVYYSGTAWYKQENQRKPVEVTSYLIREQPGNNGPFGLAVSTDGYSWLPLETKLTPDMMRLSETGGGAVVYYSPYDGSLYYYDYRGSRFAGACTAGWVEADLGFDPAEGVGTAWVDYTFRWTGDGYLMCQSVTGRGMMGTGADRFSPNNNKVIFLDRSFHRTGEHDFGAPVENVACVDGVCYALVDGTVWQSADREQWTATSLTVLPEAAPQIDLGWRIKDCPVDGQTDGSLVYRVADGKLLASGDGVYFTALCPWSSTGVELHSGGGTVVTGVGTDDVLAVDSEEVRGLCAACFGEFPTYVALDGEYFSLTDMPLRSTAGCTMAPMRELAVWMGYYDFSYDAATGTAVCSNGAESITVRVGITQGQVSGRGPVSMAVPPELVGWKLYVPVRFMVDAAGLEDVWDAEENTLWITTPEQT